MIQKQGLQVSRRIVPSWSPAAGLAQRLEDRAQLFGGVARRDSLGDGVDEQGSDALPHALRGLDGTPRLDFPRDAEDEGRSKLRDRQGADRRKNIALQASDDIARMDRRPLRLSVPIPLASHALERLASGFEVRLDLQPLCDVGIVPLAQNGISFVALFASVCQRHERIGTEGHRLVLAVIFVVPAPQLAATGG